MLAAVVFRLGPNLILHPRPTASASNLSKRKMLKIQFKSREICCPRHDLLSAVLFVPRRKNVLCSASHPSLTLKSLFFRFADVFVCSLYQLLSSIKKTFRGTRRRCQISGAGRGRKIFTQPMKYLTANENNPLYFLHAESTDCCSLERNIIK